ncbi:TPA: tRNA-modifying protein YgfZ [Vibrio vulnificus]|nr:tRNA-modifying protein YgfZ [Vibrio vulnificus]
MVTCRLTYLNKSTLWIANNMQSTQPIQRCALGSQQALPELAVSLLDNLGLITMTGNDKKSYLQGQVTCDVVSLEADQVTWGGHCDAKGKLWSAFRLFHYADGYAMLQDKSAIDVELRELKKYAIFAKVEINVSDAILLGVCGVQADQAIAKLTNNAEAAVVSFAQGTAVKISPQRWLLVVDANQQDEVLTMLATAQLCDHSLWDLYDILEVSPRIPAFAQNEHIPQAVNLQAVNGISFKKGCYTGQETVARAKYRGINKRALYRLSGAIAPSVTETTISLERSVGDNWRAAGEALVSYHFDDGRATGLFVLPNDLEPETQFRLAGQSEQLWQREPLPYSLDDE